MPRRSAALQRRSDPDDEFGSPRFRTHLTLALFALAWAAAVGVSASSRSSPASAAARSGSPRAGWPPRATEAQAAGLVGDDTCVACHESAGTSLRASLHGKAQNARTPSAKVEPGL